jgi:hypothetical protein
VVVKSSIFWDITPCGLLKVNWHFTGPCGLHLHGRRISQARNQHEAGSKQSSCYLLVSCLAYSSTLKMEATCPSEMLVEFQQTTWHIAECKTLNYIMLYQQLCDCTSYVLVLVHLCLNQLQSMLKATGSPNSGLFNCSSVTVLAAYTLSMITSLMMIFSTGTSLLSGGCYSSLRG